MDPLTAWAIRPAALATLERLVRYGPSPDATARAAQLLGRPITAPELHAMLSEELATGVAHPEATEAIATAGPASTTGSLAVIPLTGVIRPKSPGLLALLFGGGGTGLERFRAQVKAAAESEDVDQILINVDSPGGLIDQIPETAAFLREVGKVKPLYAIANTAAGSAAYWLASQANELYVTPSGSVGSIGVFIVHEDWSGYDEKLGVATTYIAAGKYKTEGNPHEPLSEEALEHAQGKMDAWHAQFISDVAKGRGVGVGAVRKGFGEGRMVMPKDAVEQGMADGVEDFESLRARLTGAKKRRSPKADGLLDTDAIAAEGEQPQKTNQPDRARVASVLLARPRRK